uniref:Uncharacterized protein n=1 Tax=Alexandrium monilatum TaxID=311494 RepID=A0A7S4SVZ1_9DINO
MAQGCTGRPPLCLPPFRGPLARGALAAGMALAPPEPPGVLRGLPALRRPVALRLPGLTLDWRDVEATRFSRRCATVGYCLPHLRGAPRSPWAAAAAAGLFVLAASRGQQRALRGRRPRGQRLVVAAEPPKGGDIVEEGEQAGGAGGAGASGAAAGASPADDIMPRDARGSQIDVLLPGPDELVNTDVPNKFLEIHRQRRTKTLGGGPGHVKGRSKRSRQKVEWRLKQGAPLAHKNWDFPSRLRVSTGIARRRRLEQPPVHIRPMMERVREALFNQVTAMHLFEDRSVRMLDLFAGTGSAGIEALSRGAAECIFVDSSTECIDCCLANAWLAGFMDQDEAAKGPMNERANAETAPLMMVGGARAKVQIELHRAQVARQPVGAVHADVFDFLENPEKYGMVNRSFNLIIASPPYNEVSYRQLCTALAKTELLERDGLVCLEYPRELGVLPPVLCAPFEDPDDADDVAAGVPVLHGLRNRLYGTTVLSIYCKLPTGARGRTGEARPWEFTESMVAKKLLTRTRDLWRTPSLFADNGERGFANPKKAPRLKK